MVNIKLLNKSEVQVAELQVAPDAIVETAFIHFDGRYYIFSGIDGRFFSSVTFKEVNPPLTLTLNVNAFPVKK